METSAFLFFRRRLLRITQELLSPAHRLQWLAVGVFTAISLPLLSYGKGERSGWMLVSQLWCTVFGYNYAIGNQPFYMENVSFLHQVTMFLGARVDHSIYSARPVYSFLASVIAPFSDMISAFTLLNYLVWAASAALTWRFTFRLFGDRLAALISVVLVAGGFGFIFHIGDYSPHLLSFLAYYLGIVLIYESRVWRESRPLRIHLFLGAYLALAYLTYDIGVPLVLGYVAVAIWRNRWWRVVIAAVIALTAKPLWLMFLPILTWLYTGQLTWINYYGFEGGLLQRGLVRWISLLADPNAFAHLFFMALGQFLFFEFPPLIVLGLLSWLALPRSRSLLWFFGVFFGLPILGGMFFAGGGVDTRGYFVYGVSLLLYAPLAGCLARYLRAMPTLRRAIALVALALIVGSQFYWSTAHLRHELGPAVSYHLGRPGYWEFGGESFFRSIPMMSLTGAEPAAVMFGGSASLSDAGLYIPSVPPIGVNYIPLFGLVSRLPLAIYVVGLIAWGVSSRRSRIVGAAAVLLGLWLMPGIVALLNPVPEPFLTTMSAEVIAPSGATARYTIHLSDRFVAALRQFTNEPVIVEFQYGMGYSQTWRVMAGDRQVPTQGPVEISQPSYDIFKLYVSLPELLKALDHSNNELTIEIPSGPEQRTSAFGWQRQGLPGRKLVDATTGSDWLAPDIPAFELRVYREIGQGKLGALLLVGF